MREKILHKLWSILYPTAPEQSSTDTQESPSISSCTASELTTSEYIQAAKLRAQSHRAALPSFEHTTKVVKNALIAKAEEKLGRQMDAQERIDYLKRERAKGQSEAKKARQDYCNFEKKKFGYTT